MIIDFDDTISPSFFLTKFMCLATLDEIEIVKHTLTFEHRDMMRAIDLRLQNIFTVLGNRDDCDVVLLTNARHTWVEAITKHFFPLTHKALFEDKHADVHSARDSVGDTYGLENVSEWKRRSLVKAINRTLLHLYEKSEANKWERADAPLVLVAAFSDRRDDFESIELGLCDNAVRRDCRRVYYEYPEQPHLHQVKANVEHMERVVLGAEWQAQASKMEWQEEPMNDFKLTAVEPTPMPRAFPAGTALSAMRRIMARHGETMEALALDVKGEPGLPEMVTAGPTTPLAVQTKTVGTQTDDVAFRDWIDEISGGRGNAARGSGRGGAQRCGAGEGARAGGACGEEKGDPEHPPAPGTNGTGKRLRIRHPPNGRGGQGPEGHGAVQLVRPGGVGEGGGGTLRTAPEGEARDVFRAGVRGTTALRKRRGDGGAGRSVSVSKGGVRRRNGGSSNADGITKL